MLVELGRKIKQPACPLTPCLLSAMALKPKAALCFFARHMPVAMWAAYVESYLMQIGRPYARGRRRHLKCAREKPRHLECGHHAPNRQLRSETRLGTKRLLPTRFRSKMVFSTSFSIEIEVKGNQIEPKPSAICSERQTKRRNFPSCSVDRAVGSQALAARCDSSTM